MFNLLTTRRFAPLFLCQFFAAFGDNFLKTSLVFVILSQVSGPDSGVLITLAGATLILPFFFLSGLGGEVADHYDKALIAQRIKLTEIGAAALAVVGFAFHSVTLLFVAVFLFGTLGVAVRPDQIRHPARPSRPPRIPAGNALIEGGTFLAILLGTIIAGIAATGSSNPIHFAWLMIVTAIASWVASLFIPKTGEGAPGLTINRNILVSTGQLIKQLRADPRLWWGGIVVSWFWLVGALVLSLLPPLVSIDIRGTDAVITVFLTIFSVAVALGSGLAAWLSAGRIVILPTLIGAVLLGLFALDLGWTTHLLFLPRAPLGLGGFFASPHSIRIAIDLAGLAIGGGLFVVPTFSAVQAWAGTDHRARVVAGVNVLNAAFMVVGAVIQGALQKLGFGVPVLFALIGAANLAVAIAIGRTMPSSWMGDFLSIVFRAFYHLEVKGQENIAKAGDNAIIALNHVSFLDPPLATALLPKRPVFAIDVAMASNWWIQPFLRFVRTMALDPLKPFSLRAIINAVRDGNMLVIFPEGRITVTGSLMKVYDGAAMIADKSDAMVVPVRIEGPEATMFSRLQTSQVRRRFFPKITVTMLEPVKLKIDPELKGRRRRQAAGAALYEVMSNLMFRSTPTDRTVVEAVIESARIHGASWLALEDPVSGRMTYRRLLQATAILGRKLMPLALEGRALGVMLPTSNAGVLTVLSVMSGRPGPRDDQFHRRRRQHPAPPAAPPKSTPSSPRALSSRRAGSTMWSAILEKQLRIVYLEDVRQTIGTADKLYGLLNWKKPLLARRPDDWAVILFTSGTEGLPKGVVLSHRNILTNVAQCAARIDFGREDKLFNALPIFHSFGFTGGTVLPLVSGVPTYLYPSPLHYRTVPELVYGVCATVLFGTDTFLNGYARMANPYDFRSLRYVVAGAEPVREATRQIYLEKFGLRILEGYGLTETSPVLALNTPMFNKFGTVGRLLPGMTAKLEKVQGIEEGGRLYVRGRT